MTKDENSTEDRFEADLKAALAPVPASADLKREILLLPLEFPRHPQAAEAASGEIGRVAGRYGRVLSPIGLGAFAAAASLALGLFVGIGGYLGQSRTTYEIDLAGIAYDPTTTLGDL